MAGASAEVLPAAEVGSLSAAAMKHGAPISGTESDDPTSQALQALARAIAPFVAAELARVTKAPDVYSSAPGGPLPRGWSRRRFLERVRTLSAACREGGKRGRSVVWTITSSDFETALASPKISTPSARVVDIDSVISAGGYRATRARAS